MTPIQVTTNRNRDSRHEAIVTTRYVKMDDSTDGWLVVKAENGDHGALCEYTKVTMVKSQGGRTYFKVAEGWSLVGQTVSLTDENAAKYLANQPPKVAVTTLRVQYGHKEQEVSPFKGPLLQQWATLNVGGQRVKVTLNSVWNGIYTPIPPGTHKIMSPDSSHAKISTAGYRNSLPGRIKGNNAWFPIELAGTHGNSSRYVHIGHLSDGCVTVHELEKWNVVYDYLISHRMPDSKGRYCALLEVSK